MPRKSYKPEEIVAKLRQVDVLTTQGKNVAEAIRSIGVSEVTYYRWRQEFGGFKRRPGEAAEGPGNGEHPVASCGVGSDTRQADIAGGISGKLLRACAALGQHRSTQCKIPHGRDDEARLTADIV